MVVLWRELSGLQRLKERFCNSTPLRCREDVNRSDEPANLFRDWDEQLNIFCNEL